MPAKSRLSSQRLAELETSQSNNAPAKRKQRTGVHLNSTWWSIPWVHTRLKRFYLVLLAVVGYLYVGNLMVTRYPQDIQNVLFPFSFLPLQAGLAWGNFFFFTWLWQHTGRGIRTTIFLALILAGKLQQAIFTVQLVTILVGIFLVLELFFFILQKIANRSDRPGRAHTHQV